jgi:hypothetical protein
VFGRRNGPFSSPDIGASARRREDIDGNEIAPQFSVAFQRSTNFLLEVAGLTPQALTVRSMPCDAIWIESDYGNTRRIWINSNGIGGTRPTGIELDPGQVLVLEVDNSRSLLREIIRFLPIVKRTALDANSFTVYGANPPAATLFVRVWLFFQSEEGY